MQVSVTWTHREQPFWPSDHPVVAKCMLESELKCGSLLSSCPFWSCSPSTRYEPSLHRSGPCPAGHRHSHGHCALMQALLPVGTPGSCCSRPTYLCPGRPDSGLCHRAPASQLPLGGAGIEPSSSNTIAAVTAPPALLSGSSGSWAANGSSLVGSSTHPH